MGPWRLAVLGLVRRPWPTALALVAIALSVATGGTLRRLDILSRGRFDRLAYGGDALVGAKSGGIEMVLGALGLEGPYPEFVPEKLYESLKAERTVGFSDGASAPPGYLRSIYPFVFFGRVGPARAIGTDAGLFARPGHELGMAEGRAFADGAGDDGAAETVPEIVVGQRLARARGWAPGDRVLVTPWAGEPDDALSPELVEFRVVGVLAATRSAWDDALFAPTARARRVLNILNLQTRSIWGAAVLHYFLVGLGDASGFDRLASLVNRRTVARAVSVPVEIARLERLTGTGKSLGRWLAGLVLSLGALATAGAIAGRFEAMASQLAVLRAIGYAGREVAAWLAVEGLLLGGAATALGAGVEIASFPLVRRLLGDALPPADVLPSGAFQGAPVWAAAILATAASVALPLARAYRHDVGVALRSQA